jgi:preprotein translocase subunit SecG
LLAYFSHARPAGGNSLLERAAISAPVAVPAPAASDAAIPQTSVPTAPAAPASGAAQIPTK